MVSESGLDVDIELRVHTMAKPVPSAAAASPLSAAFAAAAPDKNYRTIESSTQCILKVFW
jgi:hypothetical protein